MACFHGSGVQISHFCPYEKGTLSPFCEHLVFLTSGVPGNLATAQSLAGNMHKHNQTQKQSMPQQNQGKPQLFPNDFFPLCLCILFAQI